MNNQYQGRPISEYQAEFSSLLDQSIQLAGGRADHVIVLSIPDYGVTPYGQSFDSKVVAAEIDRFNQANREITHARQVTYLDITTESRQVLSDNSLVAQDGLHYSGKEYRIWADLLLPLMKEKLK